MVFVLTVEFTRDDAMSGEDQGTSREHIVTFHGLYKFPADIPLLLLSVCTSGSL